MKIYCDSSTTEACFVPEGQEPYIIPYDEPVTVNVGEYKAIILALEWAVSQHLRDFEILTDSQLVTFQVLGRWRCRKPHLLPFRGRARQLILMLNAYVTWIPRGENLAGLVLEG